MIKNLNKIEQDKQLTKNKYKEFEYKECDFFDNLSSSINGGEKREILDFKNRNMASETFGQNI